MKKKKRIGFPSYWGFGRGLAYTTLMFAKMITPEYDVYILKQGNNPIADEFKVVDVNIQEVPDYVIDPEIFKKWVTDNELDVVVFDEYNQWGEPQKPNLVEIAKELGCKVYGYLVMERFRTSLAKDYDRIIATSVTLQRFMRMHKVRQHVYIPFSLDIKREFPEYERTINEKFTFFHPGGMGGVQNRKNTEVVINAFKLLDDANTELIITSQKLIEIEDCPDNIKIISKNLSRKELLEYYKKADMVVLPSKWETVGVPCLTKETVIYTKEGNKEMGEIKLGELVLTHKGNFKRVTKVGKRKVKNILEITPKYCNKINITENHPILAIKTKKKESKYYKKIYNDICKKENLEWIKAKNIKTYDFLAIRKPKQVKNIKTIQITNFIDKKNIMREGDLVYSKYTKNMKNIKMSAMTLFKKYDVPGGRNYRLFDGKPHKGVNPKIQEKIIKEYDNFKRKFKNTIKIDKDFCRLIGFYIAEGWNSNHEIGFAFHSKETEYHNFILRSMKKIFGLKGRKSIRGNSCSIIFCSALIGNFLKNICGHLAKNKKIPGFLLNIEPTLQKEIILGYFYGDGHIKGRTAIASTVSKTLAYDMRYLLLRNNILSKVKKITAKRKNYIGYSINTSLNDSSIKLFNLEKGNPRYKFYFEDDEFFYVKVKGVKKIKKNTDVYNMEVEHDNSYCGEVIYHNCLESLAMGVPVITTDVPPMNEFIRPGINGWLCNPTMTEYDDIFVMVAEVDTKELKNKMKSSMNKVTLPMLKKNARHIALQLYDIEKTRHYFLDALREDVGE